ncbi:hypothetical protein GN956_G23503 [Arapaima gigas]
MTSPHSPLKPKAMLQQRTPTGASRCRGCSRGGDLLPVCVVHFKPPPTSQTQRKEGSFSLLCCCRCKSVKFCKKKHCSSAGGKAYARDEPDVRLPNSRQNSD